jgi:hypothetical protein
MNRRIGANLGLQLVIEGMKQLQETRVCSMHETLFSLLNDHQQVGIRTAAEHAAASVEIWAAFAKFGMGTGASSQGPAILGAVADSTVPK